VRSSSTAAGALFMDYFWPASFWSVVSGSLFFRDALITGSVKMQPAGSLHVKVADTLRSLMKITEVSAPRKVQGNDSAAAPSITLLRKSRRDAPGRLRAAPFCIGIRLEVFDAMTLKWRQLGQAQMPQGVSAVLRRVRDAHGKASQNRQCRFATL